MSKTAKRSPFAERIIKGLNEIQLHLEGKIKLKTYVVHLPEPPPEIDGRRVLELRNGLKMPQYLFARLLNVPEATLRQWESGKRKPTGAAARLLQVYAERPDVVEFITHAGNGKPAAKSSSKR